jgi:hypothetical protein
VAEFEQKKREADGLAESKTARNRAKRQKKKNRSRTKGSTNEDVASGTSSPMKKRRLVNGKELVFKAPGDNSDGNDDDDDTFDRPEIPDTEATADQSDEAENPGSIQVASTSTVVIHEDD